MPLDLGRNWSHWTKDTAATKWLPRNVSVRRPRNWEDRRSCSFACDGRCGAGSCLVCNRKSHVRYAFVKEKAFRGEIFHRPVPEPPSPQAGSPRVSEFAFGSIG